MDPRFRTAGPTSPMARSRSFRTTVFYAILGVALVPAAIALFGGVGLLREFGSSTGTLGPWDAVAESGRDLIEAALDPGADSATVAAAAARHEEALSASVRRSRVYAFVTDRISQLLPFAGVVLLLIMGGLASLVAKQISRRLGDPVNELVDWSERIAKGERLPSGDEGASGVKEFRILRRAMGSMERQLRESRERDVESARMRAWTEMARRVAHELKNPLTPIRMSASTLARSNDPQVRDSAELILEESARLDEMARTFSQLGKAPEGPMAPVDVRELLEGLVARHASDAGPVDLVCAPNLPMVVGHHEALGRAIRNLIVNAMEAVGSGAAETAGPRPRVRVSARAFDERVEITVEDEGPGIPDELLDRIWLPDVTTRRRGTGLGLAIVRQTVAAHGGSVSAGNLPGGGAVFTLDLPVDGPGGASHDGDSPASDSA